MSFKKRILDDPLLQNETVFERIFRVNTVSYENGLAWNFGQTIGYQAQRLGCGMGIDESECDVSFMH